MTASDSDETVAALRPHFMQPAVFAAHHGVELREVIDAIDSGLIRPYLLGRVKLIDARVRWPPVAPRPKTREAKLDMKPVRDGARRSDGGCAALTASGFRCGQLATKALASVQLCARHWDELLDEFWYSWVDPVYAEWRRARERKVSTEPDLVYYLCRSDKAIKIGHSRQVEKRKRDLESSAGPLELLATHAGGAKAEAKLHVRFAAYRIDPRHEWFHPVPPLLTHIARIRSRRALAIEAAS